MSSQSLKSILGDPDSLFIPENPRDSLIEESMDPIFEQPFDLTLPLLPEPTETIPDLNLEDINEHSELNSEINNQLKSEFDEDTSQLDFDLSEINNQLKSEFDEDTSQFDFNFNDEFDPFETNFDNATQSKFESEEEDEVKFLYSQPSSSKIKRTKRSIYGEKVCLNFLYEFFPKNMILFCYNIEDPHFIIMKKERKNGHLIRLAIAIYAENNDSIKDYLIKLNKISKHHTYEAIYLILLKDKVCFYRKAKASNSLLYLENSAERPYRIGLIPTYPDKIISNYLGTETAWVRSDKVLFSSSSSKPYAYIIDINTKRNYIKHALSLFTDFMFKYGRS